MSEMDNLPPVICTDMDCINYRADDRYERTEKRAIERWNTRAERTCEPIYPNDSDFRENHVARCSECRRPLVEYESGEMANFCHFCGARVVES